MAAIWCVPWFVTQDGPAHIYNAEILASSVGGFGESSPWRDVYTVSWQPIPNWAGPLSLAALAAWLPGWLADRIMTSLTLLAFAASIVWMRWRIAGTRGLAVAALMASILAMNMAWLFGFASFMLGACLFPIILGFWWPIRDDSSGRALVGLALLLILGYFCHLVSLGLIVLGLIVLCVTAPSPDGVSLTRRARGNRLVRTALTFLPLVLLGLSYVWIATGRSPMRPRWQNLPDAWSLGGWLARLKWADPISIATRDGLPFTQREAHAFAAFAPVVWLGVALVLLGWSKIATMLKHGWFAADRPFLLLATLLIAAGVIGPDSLGEAHGDYLSQRIVLLGLVAIVPILDVDPRRWHGRAAVAALAGSVILQSAVIWDYGLYSDRTAGQIIGARHAVGDGRRIAALLLKTRSRFRANPLLHAVNWLGVGTGNVVWNNYETLHYYFPVHFQPGIDRPDPAELEWISIHDAPGEAGLRARKWEELLAQHAGSIDELIVWQQDPALDAITARWFARVEVRGDVRIFHHEIRAQP